MQARLIGSMLDPDPNKRPTAQEIIDGENLRKVEEDINQAKEVLVPFEE